LPARGSNWVQSANGRGDSDGDEEPCTERYRQWTCGHQNFACQVRRAFTAKRTTITKDLRWKFFVSFVFFVVSAFVSL
jgi:hypothetical protein